MLIAPPPKGKFNRNIIVSSTTISLPRFLPDTTLSKLAFRGQIFVQSVQHSADHLLVFRVVLLLVYEEIGDNHFSKR